MDQSCDGKRTLPETAMPTQNLISSLGRELVSIVIAKLRRLEAAMTCTASRLAANVIDKFYRSVTMLQ